MAWVPTSRFEHDLVQLEPDFNMVRGQIAYELRKKEKLSGTVPIHTYEHLEAREDLLGYGTPGGRGREIRQSLQMMETIQRVAGTKPLGVHATMEDWEDTATAEREAIAITRSFGRLSVRQNSPALQPQIAYLRLLKLKASDFL
ncbi:GD22100 [Drosophila simulans]|uniref:GD22100 n=1 Tax=Drosophila simulans TaxID=7240 RepID=B4Q491_DROSI|nr:GD22100 [Drosophila simulans]